jgi:hypothetical protein
LSSGAGLTFLKVYQTAIGTVPEGRSFDSGFSPAESVERMKPEMMLSFLLDPHVVDLASGKYPGKRGTNSIKSYVFNNGSEFNMDHYNFNLAEKIIHGEVTGIEMPRVKQNGIELIINIPHFYKKIQEIIGVRTDRALYTGCHRENYQDVVKRLSVYQ